jgi:DNA-binding NarL/FixJ family response regulator
LRVLLVEDHELVRLGVMALLQRGLGRPAGAPAPEFVECANLPSALQALRGGRFDLVLLDLGLGEQFALGTLPRLREAAGAARIVVLTSMPEALYAEKTLRAGADGFVMKSEIGATLLDAVAVVLRGEVYLSPRQQRDSLRRLSGRAAAAGRPELSARELEVLRLVAAGRSTREIADTLNRSVKTIETHKQNLKLKLGADTPAQLMRQGLAWFSDQP